MLKRSTKAALMTSVALCLAQPALAQGFVISVDGQTLTGDTRVTDVVRRTDVALANADVQVTFDGLGIKPRLDVEVSGTDVVTLQSALNYPAFVTRGEMRIIDRAALGGARTVQVVDVAPNGSVTMTVPKGDDLVVVHRVYDADGRFDETAPLSLRREDTRGLEDGVEDGSDSTAKRGIRVTGGAITVAGRDVVSGARVRALGENLRPDANGGFVIQRILPAGQYGVDVSVQVWPRAATTSSYTENPVGYSLL